MFRTQLIVLAAGAALAFGFAGAALAAQPDIKSSVFPPDTQGLFWCNAVFYEESFWHEAESAAQVFYDQKSLELDGLAFAQLVDSGALVDTQYWDLWEAYAAAAYDLYETDNAGFVADREGCEAIYGGMDSGAPVDVSKP